MNYRQKLGYMTFGAGILALGITIGQWVTPNIEAQNKGMFDEITCRRLEVVDEEGKTAIRLNSELVDGNSIVVNDTEGKTAIRLHSDLVDGNSIKVVDEKGNPAVSLNSSDHNSVNVYYDGNGAISLFALGSHGYVIIRDRTENPIWSTLLQED